MLLGNVGSSNNEPEMARTFFRKCRSATTTVCEVVADEVEMVAPKAQEIFSTAARVVRWSQCDHFVWRDGRTRILVVQKWLLRPRIQHCFAVCVFAMCSFARRGRREL